MNLHLTQPWFSDCLLLKGDDNSNHSFSVIVLIFFLLQKEMGLHAKKLLHVVLGRVIGKYRFGCGGSSNLYFQLGLNTGRHQENPEKWSQLSTPRSN